MVSIIVPSLEEAITTDSLQLSTASSLWLK